jgi:hypothetical protein
LGIRDRYVKEYNEWVEKDREDRSAEREITYRERNRVIDSMGFEGWELLADHVFEIYHVGMIAKVVDQDSRYVGHITVPESEKVIGEYERRVSPYCATMPSYLRYTDICIEGSTRSRLQWIKKTMEATSWRR